MTKPECRIPKEWRNQNAEWWETQGRAFFGHSQYVIRIFFRLQISSIPERRVPFREARRRGGEGDNGLVIGQSALLDFALRAGRFHLLLDLFGLGFRNARLEGLRSAFHESLGFG